MPEDEWEEVSQDIPKKDEPFINKYLLGRDALIDQEKKQRSGALSLPPVMSLLIDLSRPCFSPVAHSPCEGSL